MQIGLLSGAPTQAKSLARLETVAPWFAATCLFMPIALLLAIGSLGRYAADDWCWPVYVRERELFALQAHMYQTSFGRWASTALLSGVGHLGPWTAGVLPGLGISAWLGAMTLFWRQVLGRWLPALILAQVIVLGVMLPAPLVAIDGVFWQTGMLTYLPALTVAFAGGALALRLNSPPVAALTAFVAAGFNESFMTLEVAALAAALLLANREHRRLIAWALAAGVVSAAIVALSPGNDARREALDPLPIALVPLGTLYKEIALLVVALPASLVLACLTGGGLSRQAVLPWRPRAAAAGVALALGLSYLAMAPTVYGTNVLSGRAAMVVLLPAVVAAFFVGARLGESVTPRKTAAVLMVASVLLAIVAAGRFLPQYTRFETYARAVDAQDAGLAAAPAGSQVVFDPAIAPYRDLWQPGSDPEFLINRCVADYYGLDSVRAP
jgi:hypothetical protein